MPLKFFHLADLHLGKIVNGFSMLEDQRAVLWQVLARCAQNKPDAILIAGDVYDRQTPSEAAVSLFDEFLTQCAKQAPIFLIGGNHDSVERLAFGGRMLQKSGVYIAPPYDGTLWRHSLETAEGACDIAMLPYVRPAAARRYFEEGTITTTQQAVAAILAKDPPRSGTRNILLAHQFVVAGGEAPQRSDSEIDPIGGAHPVDYRVFDGYDYVALGHLHGPQRIGRDSVRYAGSLLKYSFSEHLQKKAVCMVTLQEDGSCTTAPLPLTPPHDMKKIRGTFAALTVPQIVQQNAQDYLHITLTDEEEIIDAMPKLRHVYENVMEMQYDNKRSRAQQDTQQILLEQKTPHALFSEFFLAQNGVEMTPTELAHFERLLTALEEDV